MEVSALWLVSVLNRETPLLQFMGAQFGKGTIGRALTAVPESSRQFGSSARQSFERRGA